MLRVLVVASAVMLSLTVQPALGDGIMRLDVAYAPDARTTPRPLLLTVGGPIYCVQLRSLARHLHASLACTDYGPNRYRAAGSRADRLEDWGDPTYLDSVARVPAQLARRGMKISKLIVVGVSYSGFGNAELVATHPELRPAALVVVDSYLDLPARYDALPRSHQTRKEIEKALGGPLTTRRVTYAARSPSAHLDGLAAAIRRGMAFVDVWSVSDRERREFRGATCSRLANAEWLSRLAGVLGRPVTGYVTHMPHAHALWDRGMGLLAIAGVAQTSRPLLARPISFRPGQQPPTASYCAAP